MRMSGTREFSAPRFDRSIELGAHLARLPSDATCKGMFFRDLIRMAQSTGTPEQIAKDAGIPHRRYMPFLDYPMRDNLRLTVEVARRMHPNAPPGEGIRRIGRTGFATFLSSHAGRVLVFATGQDVGSILALAPRAFRLVMSFGTVTIERIEERKIVLACERLPVFIEFYQVGTVEGILEHFGARGTIRVAIEDVATGAIEVTWR